MSFKEKCPTCGTECNVHWVGLENVEASGDETMANKKYEPIAPTISDGWIEKINAQIKYSNQQEIECNKNGDSAGEEAWYGYTQALRWVLENLSLFTPPPKQ